MIDGGGGGGDDDDDVFYDDDDDNNDDYLNKRCLYHFILEQMPHVHARCRREEDAAPYTCMHTCIHAYTCTYIDACMHACMHKGWRAADKGCSNEALTCC